MRVRTGGLLLAVALSCVALTCMGLPVDEERVQDAPRPASVGAGPGYVVPPVTWPALIEGEQDERGSVREVTVEGAELQPDHVLDRYPPSTAPHLLEAPDEAPTVLTRAEVLAVLAGTSWPAADHARVASIVACESGGEVRQQRGDGGLAWGLLSVRVDVHAHLMATYDLLTAWGNLEAGWRVFEAREAVGWSGWDAWYVCSRRAA